METKTVTSSGRLPYSILVVDDDAELRWVTSLYLESAGADVAVAEDGKVAAEKALSAWQAGRSSVDEGALCLAAGCDAFLAKPLDPQELEEAIEHHVQSHRFV